MTKKLKCQSNILGLAMLMAACGFWGTASNAWAARNPNPGVMPINSNPFGMSYGNWGAAWWAWGLSIDADQNPITDPDGSFCHVGQSGPVWFLAGNFGGDAVRTCTVPKGKAIFFPILNNTYWAPEDLEFVRDFLAPYLEVDTTGWTDEELLRFGVNWASDHATSLSVTIDGVPVNDPWQYRAESDVYSIELSDVIEDFGYPPGTRSPSVADGYWIMLAPLKAGPHTIHIQGSAAYVTPADPFDDAFSVDVKYELTVE